MFLAVVYALLIVAMPASWFWVWRGRFLSKNLTGMRLEIHREQVLQSVKKMLPIWLIMVLVEVDTCIHLMIVSRDARLIWLGFFSASLLFFVGWNIISFNTLVRQEREKRRQKLEQPSS